VTESHEHPDIRLYIDSVGFPQLDNNLLSGSSRARASLLTPSQKYSGYMNCVRSTASHFNKDIAGGDHEVFFAIHVKLFYEYTGS